MIEACLRSYVPSVIGGALFPAVVYVFAIWIHRVRVDGIVESISVFHTVLVTPDGIYVAVPNGAMWSRSVKNFSHLRR